MISLDLILTILKFAGVSVSGGLGILGILFETRDARSEGEKPKLNRWGKTVLVLTLAGLTITVGALIAEELKKRSDSLQQQAYNTRLLENLRAQSQQTAVVVGRLDEQTTGLNNIVGQLSLQGEQLREESMRNQMHAEQLLTGIDSNTTNTLELLEAAQKQTALMQNEARSNQERAEKLLNSLDAESKRTVLVLENTNIQAQLAGKTLTSLERVITAFDDISLRIAFRCNNSDGQFDTLASWFKDFAKDASIDDIGMVSVNRFGQEAATDGEQLLWVGWNFSQAPPLDSAQASLYGYLSDLEFNVLLTKSPLLYWIDQVTDAGVLQINGLPIDLSGQATRPDYVSLRYDVDKKDLILVVAGIRLNSKDWESSGNITSINDLGDSNLMVLMGGLQTNPETRAFVNRLAPIGIEAQIGSVCIPIWTPNPVIAEHGVPVAEFTLPSQDKIGRLNVPVEPSTADFALHVTDQYNGRIIVHTITGKRVGFWNNAKRILTRQQSAQR